MTVNPGFGWDNHSLRVKLKKLAELDRLRKEHGYRYEIEVDGGIQPESARKCAEAGADVFCGRFIHL